MVHDRKWSPHQSWNVGDITRTLHPSEKRSGRFRRLTIKALPRTLDFHKYLALGTVAGALDRGAFSLDEVRSEADSVWEDGAACIVAISLADEWEVQFHFIGGVFSHDGLGVHPPKRNFFGAALTPSGIECDQPGAKTFIIDDELILLLDSGVVCHYRQLADGPALYKIDGRLLPHAALEKYFASLCLE